MAKLIGASIASLDGYIADEHGQFDWSAPDAEVHAFVNDLERPIGTYLYGRRMYEVMQYWATDDPEADRSPEMADYRSLWRTTDKVVYSTTLTSVTTPRTRLERTFDPEAVRKLKAATDRDLSIAGATLAGQALEKGLVDELHLFVTPIIVGGGTRALPDGVRTRLELLDERPFASGVVHLHYRVN